MRSNVVFWGGLLIVIGVLLLLSNMGLLPFPVWNLVWPLALIAFGAWILYGVAFGRRTVDIQRVSIPVEPLETAEIKINHGAGELVVGSGAGAGDLISGSFAGGVDVKSSLEGRR